MFAFGHVFNRKTFLFLLDLEIKRARRYQKYLSVLSITSHYLNSSPDENPSIFLKTLANRLKDVLRDTDIVGQCMANRLLVMLPYSDKEEAHKVRERLEQILQEYDLEKEGLTIEIDEACFPTDTTNIDDLLRMAGNHVPDGDP